MPAIPGVLAIRGLDVLFQYAFGPEAPDLAHIFGSSLRRLMNNPG